ncbi:MAG TPA: hypothetical protein VGL13_17720 [Polyangiaceae bacterium]
MIGVIGPADAPLPGRDASPRPPSKPTLLGIPAMSPSGEVPGNGADPGAKKSSESSIPAAAAQGEAGASPTRSADVRPPFRGGPKTMIGLPAPALGAAMQAIPANAPKPTPLPPAKTMVGIVGPDLANAPAPEYAAPERAPSPPPPGELPPVPREIGGPIVITAPSAVMQPAWSTADTSRTYQSAGIAIGGGLVLATVAAAFAIFWRSPAPLRAEARVDSSGTDVLHMSCATCPDGTVLRIGTTRATVAAESADVPLATPLKVGDNVFNVDVDRPANGRDETVPLVVKIGYRIRPDPSQLDNDQPKLRVVVDGAPGGTVTMGGAPLLLGAEGSANYDVDVSADCTGLADESKMIERSIPYSVGAANGGAEQGTVSLRVAVPPLRIDSPGSRATVETDHVQLAGRTGRGARLTVGDQIVGVAADGTFSRSLPLLNIGVNEVKLRAQLPGQATRVAIVQIKRVEKLGDEAKDFTSQAHLTFPTLMQGIGQHVGEPIALTGEVVDARSAGARNLALIDVKSCAAPPCLARVMLAGNEELARGDLLNVYGFVNGSVGQPDGGAAVAEIEAAFTTKNH